MPVRAAGFTLVETMMVVVILGTVALIGVPRMQSGMNSTNLRSARTALVNLIAKARASATQTSRVTVLKIEGNSAYVLARPRMVPLAGSTADTVGSVQPLDQLYGVTITAAVDSIRFDPRGLGSGFGGGTTFLISRNGHTDSIRVDGLGRVTR
ncbi:MAG TPA: GspH/FimT family pseudopilin [Gemmatimonadales bacterium]|nr:GspH/FimT family pseudopilin [Gemmatimonadales bacterium]